MNEVFDWGQDALEGESMVPEKANVVQAYLLECKLLRVVREHILPLGIAHWHEVTGYGLIPLERALEDQVFLLGPEQLQEALDRHQKWGDLALVQYLYQSSLHG